MSCDDIRAALAGFDVCEETSEGACLTTHCLYPSFEPVRVFVAKFGDGYKVHDGKGAFVAAWAHGRDEALINRALVAECSRYHLSVSSDAIVADVPSKDWLLSGILGVANASAAAATAVVARVVAAAEAALVDRIQAALIEAFGTSSFSKAVDIVGKSGGRRHFDFALKAGDHDVLINGVSPHHGSISAKYVAFADTDGDQAHKFAVYDRTLEVDDVALLQQVASIVPIEALTRGAQRIIRSAH